MYSCINARKFCGHFYSNGFSGVNAIKPIGASCGGGGGGVEELVAEMLYAWSGVNASLTVEFSDLAGGGVVTWGLQVIGNSREMSGTDGLMCVGGGRLKRCN